MAGKSSYDYEELLACARGELFGEGNAQLPYPPMLMFDRITEISETGGAFDKGFIARGVRHQAGPVVLCLPFHRQSDHARMPRSGRACGS